MKKFNCFNILWDIDDDQDVFAKIQLPEDIINQLQKHIILKRLHHKK